MQLDTPEVLYRRPATAFVARFVGFENLIPLDGPGARGGHGHGRRRLGGVRLSLDEADFGPIPDRFILGARAAGLAVADPGAPDGIPATLGLADLSGPRVPVSMPTPRPDRSSRTAPLGRPFEPGQNARLQPVAAQCCVLPDDGRA